MGETALCRMAQDAGVEVYLPSIEKYDTRTTITRRKREGEELMKIKDGEVNINLMDLFDSMSEEQKLKLAKSIACSDWMIEKLLNFICGKDDDGWWTSSDVQIRYKILLAVEDAQLKEKMRFSWSPWRDIEQRLKDILSHEHLYWRIYHHPNLSHETKESLIGKMESNLTTHIADKQIEEVKAIIENAMEEMRNV